VRCEECGYDWEQPAADGVAQLRTFGRRYRVPLTRFLPGEDADEILRTRPDPETWSVLEYAAHTRDAFVFYDERVARVLAEERPQLDAFGFDAACAERRYNEQNPAQVASELDAAAAALADRAAGAAESEWQRVGIGSDGDERTVLVLLRRAVHEGHHHLLDIGRVARHARGRA
jgi:hypothetical protein